MLNKGAECVKATQCTLMIDREVCITPHYIKNKKTVEFSKLAFLSSDNCIIMFVCYSI